jgi:hypothetical protein
VVATSTSVREGEPVTQRLPDDAEGLFDLDPSEFIAARNALAKRLRAEKRRDDAVQVAALRRPSPAAWALNQVARRTPAVIEAAMEAITALQDATDAAIAGHPEELRRATTAERSATNDVVQAAAEDLGARTEGVRQALVATLRAAAADGDVADQLRRGVLTSEHEPSGFGFGDDLARLAAAAETPRVRAKRTEKAQRKSAPRGGDDKAAQREAAAAERAAAKARADRAKEAERLARTATRLEQAAERAERSAEVADDGAALAEEAARDARNEADEAQARARDARAEAARARSEATAAERAVGKA